MGLKYAKSKDERSTLWVTVFEDRVACNKQFTHCSISPISHPFFLFHFPLLSFFLGLPKHRQQFTRINCVLLFRNSGISREMDLLCFCGGTQSSLRHKPYRRRKAAQAISFDPKNRIWRQSPKCSFTIFYRFFWCCSSCAATVRCQSLLILLLFLFFPYIETDSLESHFTQKHYRKISQAILLNIYKCGFPNSVSRTVVVVLVDETKSNEKKMRNFWFWLHVDKIENRSMDSHLEQRLWQRKTKSL